MKKGIYVRCLIVMAGFCAPLWSMADPLAVSTPVNAIPPNIVSTANKPMMMLATSKDHTLFGPIYTDFEDIDEDGVIDTTFKPDFKYYGYFDSTKCYNYANSRFQPAALATVTTDHRYTCPSTESWWSGNFLNWATMTRLDVIRKMLYGGKRSTDTNVTAANQSGTVLERANLSKDSHSFVKYYRGTDIRDYTPFTTAALTKATGSNANVYAGLSICNRSDVMDEGGNPVIRMAKGNYRLWATVEGTVCEWGAGSLGRKLARYYKDTDKGNGGISHEENPPDQATDGATYGSTIGPQINVRVQVCKAGLLGDERCQAFPANSTTNYKPYGIFQEFGLGSSTSNAARSEFGVITGSYDKNLTAGALRKNMGDFADEINTSTGIFCHMTGSSCAATVDGRATGQGAIKALDSYVLYGRGAGGNYGGSNAQLPSEMADGTLPAWGNPIGEMVVQALQYYAGVTSTNPSSTTNDTNKGLPVLTWADPLSNASSTRKTKYGNAICRPMYTLALSSSALSFDGQAGTNFNTLPNTTGSISDYVDAIGTAEGINGTVRSVGSVGGANTFGETCSGKTISTLSNVSGICPEAPGIGGTYQVAGAALYANTAKIRNVTTPPADLKFVQNALKVKTMAASLSGGAARIEVPIPNSNPKKYVYITPESLWNAGGKRMPGALLTFASINSGPLYGTFVVTWNDSLFGGDYDMDIAGFLRYDVRADAASPSGYSIDITTDILNVGAGYTGTHGFSVMGTDQDRRYLTHRHEAGSGDGPMVGAEGFECEGAANTGVSRCRVGSSWNTIQNTDYPILRSFKMVGVSNVLVQEPLWYAAKYGSFNSSSKNSDGTYSNVTMPPDVASWDNLRSDGSIGSDGVPDGYFLARRPDILESQLRKALDALAKDSNAAPAISSAQLVAEGYKYVAKFDSTTVTGMLEAYKVDGEGDFGANYTWEAGGKLLQTAAGGGTRKIITNYGNGASAGTPFRWGDLSADYKTRMQTGGVIQVSAANAEVTVNYVRGDQSREGLNGLRQREGSLLGPIVNGTPWIQGRPSGTFYGTTGYATFYDKHKSREKLLWVAANDGMLHAFNVETGAEVFAYVPGTLANRLVEIPLQRGTTARTQLNGANFTLGASETQPTGTVWPYVDGNPFTADVKVGSGTAAEWRTYALGTLGRGGKAVFALDVSMTAPGSTSLPDVSYLSEGNASNIFKWEFTSDDDADLGYVVSDVAIHPATNQPTPIAKMNNGKFAMLIGNGNRSSTGKAVLFVLYMDGPDSTASWTGRYDKIVADTGTGNGLATPRWEDVDGDGTADVIYAGDIKGNMWKFNVSNIDPANWDVAYKSSASPSTNLPLFHAVYQGPAVAGVTPAPVNLPISTAPQVLYMGKGGMMITFGTGAAFQDTDGTFPNPTAVNRMYGIWDRPGLNGTRPLPNENGSTLLARTYTRDATTGIVTTSSATVIDWSTYDGWYFNLPGTSESVLSDPSLDAGVLTFVAVRPKTANSDDCSNTPNAALFTVDPISGRAERNTQGTVEISTYKVVIAGQDIGDQKVRVVNDRTKKPFTKNCKPGEAGCTCTGNDCTKDTPTCTPGQRAKRVTGRSADAILCSSSSPRLQWREIPGLRTDQ